MTQQIQEALEKLQQEKHRSEYTTRLYMGIRNCHNNRELIDILLDGFVELDKVNKNLFDTLVECQSLSGAPKFVVDSDGRRITW